MDSVAGLELIMKAMKENGATFHLGNAACHAVQHALLEFKECDCHHNYHGDGGPHWKSCPVRNSDATPAQEGE